FAVRAEFSGVRTERAPAPTTIAATGAPACGGSHAGAADPTSDRHAAVSATQRAKKRERERITESLTSDGATTSHALGLAAAVIPSRTRASSHRMASGSLENVLVFLLPWMRLMKLAVTRITGLATTTASQVSCSSSWRRAR